MVGNVNDRAAGNAGNQAAGGETKTPPQDVAMAFLVAVILGLASSLIGDTVKKILSPSTDWFGFLVLALQAILATALAGGRS